jgi:hypothetical protein
MMNYPELQTDILDVFAEAHRRWHSWNGELPITLRIPGDHTHRDVEIDNYVAKRRIVSLSDYKRRLLAGERPRGLNIRIWQQAAACLGIVLTPTQPRHDAGP